MKPCISLLRIWVLLLAVAGLARAQVTFTFNVTAQGDVGVTDDNGYIGGQSYQFTFVALSSASAGVFFRDTNISEIAYIKDFANQPSLVTNVSGGGLSGSYVCPTAPSDAPWEALSASYSTNLLSVTVSNDYSESLGLSLNGNVVTMVGFSGRFTNLTFNNPTGSPTVGSYFADRLGTYDAISGTYDNWVATAGDIYTGFTVNSLTISSAVPEPSTYAALAGLGTLGIVALRRRRKSKV